MRRRVQTRREFVTQMAVAGTAVVALPAKLGESVLRAQPAASIHAVVSIHLDQPYIDVTGRAVPYRPPAGLRGGAAVAHLSETEFRRCFVYL